MRGDNHGSKPKTMGLGRLGMIKNLGFWGWPGAWGWNGGGPGWGWIPWSPWGFGVAQPGFGKTESK